MPGPGGVPGPGRGVSAPGGGGCLVETPRTATAAGGTHPTGMHSCLEYSFKRPFLEYTGLRLNIKCSKTLWLVSIEYQRI